MRNEEPEPSCVAPTHYTSIRHNEFWNCQVPGSSTSIWWCLCVFYSEKWLSVGGLFWFLHERAIRLVNKIIWAVLLYMSLMIFCKEEFFFSLVFIYLGNCHSCCRYSSEFINIPVTTNKSSEFKVNLMSILWTRLAHNLNYLTQNTKFFPKNYFFKFQPQIK